MSPVRNLSLPARYEIWCLGSVSHLTSRDFQSPANLSQLPRRMVPTIGLAPTRPCGHSVLNAARLLLRHAGKLVPVEGFAPPRLAASGFEPGTSAIPSYRQSWCASRDSNPSLTGFKSAASAGWARRAKMAPSVRVERTCDSLGGRLRSSRRGNGRHGRSRTYSRRFRRPSTGPSAWRFWSGNRESNSTATSLATISPTMGIRAVGRCGRICTFYLSLIRAAQVCICSTSELVCTVGAAPTTSEFQARPSAVDLRADDTGHVEWS